MKETHFAATAYVIFQDRVLLIKHPKIKRWLPVGGKIDPGETPDQAVIREIKEEVGIDVEIINKKEVESNKVFSYRYTQLEDLGSKYHFDFIYYTKADTYDIKLENEIDEAHWFTYEEYLNIKDELFDDVKKELEIIFLRDMPYDPYKLIDKRNTELLKKHDCEIIVVNHCDSKTERFIRKLKYLFGTKIYFNCKKYSYDSYFADRITEYVDNKDFLDIEPIIKRINDNRKRILVFDLSGIFYSRIEDIYENSRVFLIEDTKNGHQNAKEKNRARLSVATSEIKKLIENPLVAKGIFDAFITYCMDHRYELGLNKKVLVLGTGSIGSFLLNLLENRFTEVYGHDTDLLTSSRMLLFNHKMIKDLEDLNSFDIIFGITGNDNSLKPEQLGLLKDNVILVNGSTDNSEFSQYTLLTENSNERFGSTISITQKNKKRINLLNHGNPINFYKNTGTDRRAIDTMFAYMIDCLVEWSLYGNEFDAKDYSTDMVIDKGTSEKYIHYFFNNY